jgi:hypothetical protein
MHKHVLAVLLLAAVACGGDKATGPQTATGSYTLRTANGASVPAVVFQNQTEKDEVTAGTINLAADKTWSGTLGLRGTDLSTGQFFFNDVVALSGTYTLTGNSLTLDDPFHELTATGTVSGGTIAIAVDLGLPTVTAMVYQK